MFRNMGGHQYESDGQREKNVESDKALPEVGEGKKKMMSWK